jgi:hypothetical protein
METEQDKVKAIQQDKQTMNSSHYFLLSIIIRYEEDLTSSLTNMNAFIV